MASSVASRVRERVRRSKDRFWSVEDFEDAPHAVATELSRLAKAEELRRVRRGVYWRGRPNRFGMAGAPPVAAVRELVSDSESVGAAGWYAANLLGLSTQVSPVPVVALSRRPPSGLENVKVIDRSNRWGRREAQLNETEVTLLEALEGWDRYVELDHNAALTAFVELLGSDEVRASRLVKAAPTESPRVRERLRAVLAAAGLHDEAHKVPEARDPRAKERAQFVLPKPL